MCQLRILSANQSPGLWGSDQSEASVSLTPDVRSIVSGDNWQLSLNPLSNILSAMGNLGPLNNNIVAEFNWDME